MYSWEVINSTNAIAFGFRRGNRMKNKILKFILCTILIISLYDICNLYKNNKVVSTTDFYHNKEKNDNLDYITVEEIRNQETEVRDKLINGGYGNLVYDNTSISICKSDEVSYIHEYAGGLYKGITDAKELADIQLELIFDYLGEDVQKDYIMDMNGINSWYDKQNDIWCSEYYTNSEVMEALENGTYGNLCSQKVYGYSLPFLFYGAWSNVEGEYRYAHFSADMNRTVVFKGELLRLEENNNEFLEYEYEPIATYYDDSKNLDDKYTLINGETTIREAINYVERYFNEELPYEINNKTPKKVVKVEVYEIKGIICLEFYVVRDINGMETEYGYAYGNVVNMKYIQDASRAVMINKNELDEYCLYMNTLKQEKEGDNSDMVVSLDSALELISGHVGKNSMYKVKEARMAYRTEIINDADYENEYLEIPCWIIRCENLNDGRGVYFYINIINGNMDYVTVL